MRIRVYSNFLRFMNAAEQITCVCSERISKSSEARKDAPGFAFVIRSMKIDFLKPAILDDLLEVVTVPEEVRGASIALLQGCRRGDDR